ncbi:MAG: DNA repair protein RecO [Lachnospiraceae bacterium]
MQDTIYVSGVVMLSAAVGDYDRRLVLLTKERGKITVFARGARRAKSALLAPSRLFAFGTFELREGRDAYTLVSADILRYFEELETDIEKVAYACYFMELANYYARENIESTELLNLIYVSFCALIKESIPNSLIRYIYEFRSMVIFGEYPNLFECSQCREALREGGVFSIQRNGIFCRQHGSGAKQGIWISQGCIYTLQYIATAPLTKLYTFQTTDEVFQQLQKVVDSCRKRYVDGSFTSLSILNGLA